MIEAVITTSSIFLTAVLASGIIFWAAVVGFFVLMILLTETESDFKALFTLAVFVTILQLSGHGSIVDFVKNSSWVDSAKYIIEYFLIGCAYSIVKWYFYVASLANKYKELKLEYAGSLQLQKAYPTLNDYLKQNSGLLYPSSIRTMSDLIPKPAENKDRLTRWVTWWPCSFVWTLINDPVRKLVKWLVANLQGVYTRISNHVFAGMFVDDAKDDVKN